MERTVDKILKAEKKIGKGQWHFLDVLFVICLLLISLEIRLSLFPSISGDYSGFLEPWMEEIRRLGGWASLGKEISNYSSAYMIIMSLLSYVNADPLYLLKGVSVLFDYVAAAAVFLIINELTGSVRKSIGGMGALLLAPTVILNGSYWCQCDIIYTSFLLFGIYFLCKGDGGKALFLTALGFAFKLQALFILPFYVIMWLCPLNRNGKKGAGVQLKDFLIIPLPYLLLTLPSIIMGRDIWNSIGVYFEQTDYYPWLTLNYPNIYTFFGQTYLSEYYIPELGQAGIFVTLLLLGFLAYYLYGKKSRMNGEMMITTALFSLCLVLYCLPYMHERYGMLIDVVAVIYGVLRPRKAPIAIGLLMSSLISYMPFLFGKEGLPLIYHALLQMGLIAAVGLDLYKQVNLQNQNPLP